MKFVSVIKIVAALSLTSTALLLQASPGRGAGGQPPAVTIEAVSGYAGHAFVYAKVQAGNSTYPAPTGTHLSPYYAEWIAQPVNGGACPWVWAVYVFDRATNTQINPTPPNAPTRNFGTTTIVCPKPSATPVAMPPIDGASARLDLDLAVAVNPTVSVAGSASALSASLSSSLTQDLGLYMNMAIENWQVTDWFLDFGDGQTANRATGTTSVVASHTYQAAGQYDARAIASIAGSAQAAVYDHYGNPMLVQEQFALQIGNDALASTRARAVRRYLPPSVVVTVSPSLDSQPPDSSVPGLRQVEVMRGRLTNFAVRAVILKEGALSVDGRVVGSGTSRLTAWRLDGSAWDAPRGAGTVPGAIHSPVDSLVLQWNSPAQVLRSQPQGISVPVTLFVQTRYPDGHVVNFAIATDFVVLINFLEQTG